MVTDTFISYQEIISAPQGKNAVCAHFLFFKILSFGPFYTYCVFTLSNNNVIFTCISEQTKGVNVY